MNPSPLPSQGMLRFILRFRLLLGFWGGLVGQPPPPWLSLQRLASGKRGIPGGRATQAGARRRKQSRGARRSVCRGIKQGQRDTGGGALQVFGEHPAPCRSPSSQVLVGGPLPAVAVLAAAAAVAV